MKRKEAIKQIQEGKIQVYNDLLPITKEIKKFLKEAFPNNNNDKSLLKTHKYIVRNRVNINNHAVVIGKNEDLPIINLSTITKRKKTKLSQLEKQFSDLAKDVVELKRELLFTSVSCRNFDVVDAEEVKSELIVGEWYKWKYPTANFIFRITKIGRIYIYYHGIDDGEWSERFIHKDNNFEKATPQEVQSSLEKEAKKRGFVNEVTFTPLNGDKEVIRNGNSFGFIEDTSQLLYGNYLIFQDGIWAEIIQQETIKEKEIDWSVNQYLKINQTIYIYLGEHDNEHCTVYSKGLVKYTRNPKGLFEKSKGELTIK